MEGIVGLSLAQSTGIFVAFIYGFGTDLDVVFAVPVAFLSGATAWFIEQSIARTLARYQAR